MPTLAPESTVGSLLELLAEAYEGPSNPANSWFTTNEANAGIFGTLDSLSAQDASRAPAPGSRSAAAHAAHLRFSMGVSARWLRGDQAPVNWAESWSVSSVDARGWVALRASLRDEYRSTVALLREDHDWRPEAVTGAFAIMAHAAYHLGALRQIAIAARKEPGRPAE